MSDTSTPSSQAFRTRDFDDAPDFSEMKRRFGTPDPEPEKAERIDHAAEARQSIEESGDGRNPASAAGTNAITHALLALVEQKRIDNLIAYGQGLLAGLRHGPIDLGDVPTAAYSGVLDDLKSIDRTIREGLGLS